MGAPAPDRIGSGGVLAARVRGRLRSVPSPVDLGRESRQSCPRTRARPKVSRDSTAGGYGPSAVLPRHVRACVHYEGERTERWGLWLWPKHSPTRQVRVPYACKSWRCNGPCSRYEASVTFSRLRTAIMNEELDADGWCFIVLTVDRHGYYSGKPWWKAEDAYRQLSPMSRKLIKRFRRMYNHPIDKWAQVVEAHRSGFPHLNVLMYCPPLAADLRREQERRMQDEALNDAVHEARALWKERRSVPPALREQARQAITMGGELLRHTEESGWGRQSSAESVRDREALAGYIVKLIGEVAKLSQRPLNAPERFRRLRTSVGLLAKRRKNKAMTGVLVRRALQPSGEWQIVGMNATKRPEDAAAVDAALCNEVALIEEEENLLSQRGALPPMPPVRHATHGKLESWDAPRGPPDSEVFENTG